MNEAIKAFFLELGRVAVIAVVPITVTMLETDLIDWKVIAVTAVIAVLKAVDRALHESKVAEKGLVRF